MDFKTNTLRELRDRRAALSSKQAVLGLDGFVDTIVTPVGLRAGQGDNFTPITTITEFGQRIFNSLYTLGIMIGMTVYDTTLGTTVANLGMTDVTFPKPVFHGDTLRATTKVISVRESRSRPKAGIVEFEHHAYNQHDEVVGKCRRMAMMHKRPA